LQEFFRALIDGIEHTRSGAPERRLS
jgi:hypothetical protein